MVVDVAGSEGVPGTCGVDFGDLCTIGVGMPIIWYDLRTTWVMDGCMLTAGGTNEDRAIVVSVIIPVYNCATTLGAQLDALAAQASDVPEMSVVDNGSTDGTRCLIEQYLETMPHLKLVHAPEEKDVSRARNVGTANARGEDLSVL